MNLHNDYILAIHEMFNFWKSKKHLYFLQMTITKSRCHIYSNDILF